jgi:hypothetical protein
LRRRRINFFKKYFAEKKGKRMTLMFLQKQQAKQQGSKEPKTMMTVQKQHKQATTNPTTSRNRDKWQQQQATTARAALWCFGGEMAKHVTGQKACKYQSLARKKIYVFHSIAHIRRAEVQNRRTGLTCWMRHSTVYSSQR